MPILNASANASIILFDYNVCPTLILAAILGEVSQFAMVVSMCVHSRNLSMSIVKSLLYFEALKTRYGLSYEMKMK